jgi:hypothetical protein
LNFVPNDGYTEPGYLAAVPGKYSEMRFTFRPLLAEEKRIMAEQVERMKPAQEVQKVAGILMTNVKMWDLKDGKGEVVPISLDTVRRLKPSVFWALWGIVSGSDASDIDPQWEEADKERIVGEQIAAISAPAPYGESREASDEKN